LREDLFPHVCQRLQFLQMASEKICKAHALLVEVNTLESVTSEHSYIKKFLAKILDHELLAIYPTNRTQCKLLASRFKLLGVEIEALCPAINRVLRPDNCEYPWESGETVLSPLDWKFESLEFLRKPGGGHLLNV
jgi:hypothetical protein